MSVYIPRYTKKIDTPKCEFTVSAPSPSYARRSDVTIYYSDGKEIKSVTYTYEQRLENPTIEIIPQIIYVDYHHYDIASSYSGDITRLSVNYSSPGTHQRATFYVYGNCELWVG